MAEAKRVEIAESLQFYFGGKAHQAAVGQVLQGPAKDFDWQDLDEFYEAWLSAQKVKVDYWLFLREVWDKVWGETLKEYFPAGRGARQGEQEAPWYDGENWLEKVWDGGWLYRGFSWGSGEDEKEALFGVWDNGDLGLCFWLWDGHQYLKELEQGEDWVFNDEPSEGEEDGGEYHSSVNATLSLVPLRDESLDLGPLIEQAQEAVKKMADYLPR